VFFIAANAGYGQCTTTPIKCGEEKFGNLSSNTCAFSNGGVYSRFSFSATAGQHVDIFLEASTFRPQLALYGPAGGQPVAYDDFPGTSISYVKYDVPTAGTYAIAAGGYGFGQVSGTFRLTMYCQNGCAPPVIVAPLTPRTIAAGESATLSIRADGTAPLHYTWRDLSDPTVSVGSDSSTFITGPLFSTKRYQVTVTNACGSVDSIAAEVKVACDPPVITSQPGSVASGSPGGASVSVAAIGTAPLSYEWFYGSPGDTSRLAGIGPTLSLQAITATTQIWARVTNSCGAANSTGLTITITPVHTRRRTAGH